MSLLKSLLKSVCVWLALTLITVNAAKAEGNGAVEKPRLTEAQALQIATDFCRRIGRPLTSVGSAQFPEPEQRIHATRGHWQERWWIQYPEANIEVVDATGEISHYQDFVLFHNDAGRAPAGPAISRQKALQIAQSVLAATGASQELKLDRITEYQIDSPPTIQCHEWFIFWKRYHKGIPYQSDHAAVSLNAETGEVTGSVLFFPAAPPADTVGSITRAQADAIARAVPARAGEQNTVLDSVDMEMIQPNTFWEPGGDAQTRAREGHAAWVYRFHNEEQSHEVWIDVHTGEVLGGFMMGNRGRSAKPARVPAKPQGKKVVKKTQQTLVKKLSTNSKGTEAK